MGLALKYVLFAAVATLVNIAAQDLAGRAARGPLELYVSMACGTLAGLATKYVLDKKYIFAFAARSLAEDGRKFVLYSFMGVFTTCIFWGTEMAFDLFFATKVMRYTGAVLGLAVGYWVKYRLDKRFVFAALIIFSIHAGIL